jgi:Pyruvate/2-oxoacid:ferredoxin oxidoreductase delta subunit
LAEKETVVVSCEKSTHDHITIPCIGLFSEPLLAAINSVTKRYCFIDVSRCDECINRHCLQLAELNLRNLTQKAGENSKIKVKFIRDDEKPNVPSDKKVERRSFLKLAGKTITNVSKDVADVMQPHSNKEANAYNKHPIRITSALQYALANLPKERTCERDVLLSYFFSVSTNGKCDCCPLCTGMCPTGALKRKKENDKKSLTFTSGKCSGCGLCNDFCKKKAIILKNGFHGDPNISQKISDQ